VLFPDFAEAFVHRRPSFCARVLSSIFKRLSGSDLPSSGHVIAGLRVRPFSRWHAANLDFIESPLAGHKTGSILSFGDYWIAAECCRLRWPRRYHLRRGWLYRIRRLLAQRRYQRDPITAINAFTAYFSDYCTRPELIPGDDSREIKTPWYLHEVCALLQLDSRLTKAEAWDMPVAEGAWWITASAEANGSKIDLVTPEDRAHELSEEEFAENCRQEALIEQDESF
jgi:hypothetical protein